MVSSSVTHVPLGYLSLYELNVNRDSDQLIYPFVTKDGFKTSFKSVTSDLYDTVFDYGDTVQGSYPLSASISREFYSSATRPKINSLKNICNYYRFNSEHYRFSSSLGDKSSQEIGLVNIPSIFYGSNIKRGSVDMRFYVSGTLVGKLRDSKANGELIQYSGSISDNDTNVAGVVLYNEGVILLTGSWPISSHADDYLSTGSPVTSSWKYWGAMGNESDRLVSSSYEISLSGTNPVQTITMFAHAPKGMLNNSSNPTFIEQNSAANLLAFSSGSHLYEERHDLKIKNTSKIPYSGSSGSFEKQTFISMIGIYDENKNLLGISKLARPIRKTENRALTFKMKLDV